VYVNLFIPSEVRCADQGITLRQATGFPDDPVVRLTVVRGTAPMTLRVRVPSWTAGPPGVVLNGTPLRNAVVPSGTGGWVAVSRHWRPGDWLEVTLPMRLALTAAPDDPAVQAVTYGPVVLSGLYGASYATAAAGRAASAGDAIASLPVLDVTSVRRIAARPMTFTATADARRLTMVPVARAQHQHYTVYWHTA
jgi:hypothetical protein